MSYGQASDEPLPRISLVVPVDSRYGANANTDARLINAYAEKDETGAFQVYSRDGIGLSGQTITPFPGVVYYPCGMYTYFPYPGTSNTLLFYLVASVRGGVIDLFLHCYGGSSFGGYVGCGSMNLPHTQYIPTASQIYAVLTTSGVASQEVAFFYPNDTQYRIFTWNGTSVGQASLPAAATQLVAGIAYLDQTVYVMDVASNIWGGPLGQPSTGGQAGLYLTNSGSGYNAGGSGTFTNIALATNTGGGSGATLASVTLVSGVITSITPGVQGAGYLPGDILTIGQIGAAGGQGTCAFSVTAVQWNSTNFIQAVAVAGTAVALTQHKSLIVAMKTNSLEFFYDAANTVGGAGSPLLPIPNSTINWGCVDGSTVQSCEDKLFWLGTANAESYFVAMMENRQARRISTPGIERMLDNATGPYYSFTFNDQGHTFYVLTSVGANLTIVYDISQGIWCIWQDPNGNYWPWAGFVGTASGAVWCQSLSGANIATIYSCDEVFLQDNGATFVTDIYTPNYDAGSRRRDACQRMDFIADQGPGVLYSRWNNSDYAPTEWSPFRAVDLNVKRPSLTKNGSFRRRAWNFRWKSGVYRLRLEAVELTMLEGMD